MIRKASRILLLIWDILLIPPIIGVLATVLNWQLPFTPPLLLARIITFLLFFYLFLVYLLTALSHFFMPQVITLVLITLSWAMPFRPWEEKPAKKEILQLVILTVIGIAGAVCAFISLVMMSRGEMGQPLP